jgi:hypothetical protein
MSKSLKWSLASLLAAPDCPLYCGAAAQSPAQALKAARLDLCRRAGVEMGVDGELRSERPDLDVLA